MAGLSSIWLIVLLSLNVKSSSYFAIITREGFNTEINSLTEYTATKTKETGQKGSMVYGLYIFFAWGKVPNDGTPIENAHVLQAFNIACAPKSSEFTNPETAERKFNIKSNAFTLVESGYPTKITQFTKTIDLSTVIVRFYIFKSEKFISPWSFSYEVTNANLIKIEFNLSEDEPSIHDNDNIIEESTFPFTLKVAKTTDSKYTITVSDGLSAKPLELKGAVDGEHILDVVFEAFDLTNYRKTFLAKNVADLTAQVGAWSLTMFCPFDVSSTYVWPGEVSGKVVFRLPIKLNCLGPAPGMKKKKKII